MPAVVGDVEKARAVNFNLALPFFERSKRDGARLALWVAGAEVSYKALAGLAQRVSAWLKLPGARPPGYVVVLASRSLEAYAGVLGACWAGDAYVPVSPHLPAERLAQIIRVVNPVAVVVDAAGAKALSQGLHGIVNAPVLESLEQLPAANPDDDPRFLSAHDTVYMIFTSGSTGIPKGVVVPAGAVSRFVANLQSLYRFEPADRFSNAYNLSFDGSVHDMFCAWGAGASVHVVPPEQLLAPSRFIRDRQLTVWSSVPSTAVIMERMKMLVPGAFPSLRYTIFGGEPLPVRSATAWMVAAPHSTVDNLYGPTECCVFSNMQRFSERPTAVTPKLGVVAIGKPLAGFAAEVWDAAGSAVETGVEGEFVLAGPQLADGYFGDAELTADKFCVRRGARWYRTGDLVCMDDSGVYHHLGRIDAQVKVLGHRVELGEVEAHLKELCGSDAVVAVAWPVEHGSAKGIVVFHCADGMSPQAIREALSARLPHYMVPHLVKRMDSIPLTANGKVDRRSLLDLLDRESSARA